MKTAIVLLAACLLSCGGQDPPPGPPDRSFLFSMRNIPGNEGRFVAGNFCPWSSYVAGEL